MNEAPFRIVRLGPGHDRAAFDCGSDPLNLYLREQVTQDIRRHVTFCFVALAEEGRIAGFYTLASASFLTSDLPDNIRRKLPRYPTVPAVRLGRLAVDNSFKGQGLGGALLADALTRAVHSDIASYAMIVEAKDAEASAFYRHYGFIAFPDKPLILFLPLATVRSLGLSH